MSEIYSSPKIKIDHPWWHWFFTDLHTWANSGAWEIYYCSKCKKAFKFYAEKVDIIDQSAKLQERKNEN